MAKNEVRMSLLKQLNKVKDETGIIFKTELSWIFNDIDLHESEWEKLIWELHSLEYIELLWGFKWRKWEWYRTIKITWKWIGEMANEWNEKKYYISAWTHIQAWWDIIIWDNNKNTINEIEKIIELIEKTDIQNKEEIKKLFNDFKLTQDRSKLVDIFSILWNGASINSMLVALSSLL